MRTVDTTTDRAWANFRAAEQRLAWEQPFHAHHLATMRVRPDDTTETMQISRVDGIVTIGFCCEFVAGLTIRQAEAVLKHELNHLVFGHLSHTCAQFPDTVARVIAEEVSANEWIPTADLPGNPVLLEQFPELSPGQTFEERYRILRRMDLRNDPRTACLDQEVARRQSARVTITLADVARMVSAATTDLGALKAAKGMPAGKQKAILAGIGRGNELGGMGALIEASGEAAVVPWVRMLRRFLSTQSEGTRPTYCRPSRRHRDLAGLVPGWESKPANPRVMLVLDTSGSMTDSVLSLVQREIRALVPHSEVWMVQCDTRVHEIRRLSVSDMATPLRVHGRGGTDFRPALAPEVVGKIRPAWILVFTDGHGPAPEQKPPCKLAWVLGGHMPTKPAAYGEAIWLDVAGKILTGSVDMEGC